LLSLNSTDQKADLKLSPTYDYFNIGNEVEDYRVKEWRMMKISRAVYCIRWVDPSGSLSYKIAPVPVDEHGMANKYGQGCVCFIVGDSRGSAMSYLISPVFKQFRESMEFALQILCSLTNYHILQPGSAICGRIGTEDFLFISDFRDGRCE
jgi:hypothetical protein